MMIGDNSKPIYFGIAYFLEILKIFINNILFTFKNLQVTI